MEPAPAGACIRTMRTRTVLVLAIVVLAACGTTPPRPSSNPDRRDAPPAVTLVQTVHGVAGVTRGTDTIRWQIDGAGAAVDGSAVFTRTPAGELARVDRTTGEITARWPMAPDLAPVLVAPGGHRVLVSDRPLGYDSEHVLRPSTHLQVRTGP